MVSQLQTNLEASMPILERTSFEMEKLMVVLLEKKVEADATKAMVKEEEMIAIEEVSCRWSNDIILFLDHAYVN